MDLHESRGYNPLSGEELKSAICGSLRKALDNNGDFTSNVAWPVAKWKIHAEVEYAPNIHAQPTVLTKEILGSHTTLTTEGNPVQTVPLRSFQTELSNNAEAPDLTREEFIEPFETGQAFKPIASQPSNPSMPHESSAKPQTNPSIPQESGAKPEMMTSEMRTPKARKRP